VRLTSLKDFQQGDGTDMGRHREFDPNEALHIALQIFRRQGYEGTSISDLTEAMGITRPSLYARQHLCFAHEALQALTARDAVEKLLRGYADVLTDPMNPPGCLGVNGAVACSEASEAIREELIARRMVNENNLRDRLEQARSNGDFPQEENPADWARYVVSIGLGMAVRAASGASRGELHRVVDFAMRAWPAVPT
jgi:AcrR family transcriptional regulator